MMGKTHLAVGLATSLAIIQPRTFSECAVAVIGGAMGGVIADNDILDNDYPKDALLGQFLAFGVSVAAIVSDCFFGFGICRSIINTPAWPIVGGVVFAILYVVGIFSHHRTFTHSFLAMILYGIAVALIYTPVTIAFVAAYLSHLVLDILNKKKIPVLFPWKYGICFNLCYANKTANEVLMYVGFTLSGLLLAVGIVFSFIGT